MIDPIIQYFRQHFNFAGTESKWTPNLFKYEIRDKKDLLVREGDYCRDLFFIVNGFARTFHFTKEGIETTTDICGPGALVTSIYSLLRKVPAHDNVQCVTKCEIYRLSNKAYQQLRREDMQWFELGYRILKYKLLEKEDRIRQFAKLSASQRYDQLLEDRPDVIATVPLQYIASYLGMKPESLSRIRHKLTIS